MKVKKITAFIAAILLIAALSGCASQQSGGTSTASPTSTATVTPSDAAATDSASTTTSDSAEKTFTLDELKTYNGQNGQPAYVAVDGVVYDVTDVKEWNNGSHQGYSAGQDLTDAISQSPHGTSILSDSPIVGTLQS